MLYRVEDALVRVLPSRRLSIPVAYLGATLIVSISFFIRWWFAEYWQGYPVLLFTPAIFLSALLFGRGSGLYATALSAALVAYFFIEPAGFAVNARERLPFVAFVIIGSGVGFLTEILRHALDRIAAGERQKDLLLHELAHRTKNDFMTIASMLRLQSRDQPEATRAAFDAAADRVGVVASVHDQLHRRAEHAVVDAREYLEALCGSLSAMVRGARPISVEVAAERVALRVESAVPVGLIVNELVTNALKYAFPDGRGGTIDVGFKMTDPETAEIVVHDDGIGCPATARDGLGTQIVRLLAKQMKGTVTREGGHQGCRAVVRVQLKPA